MSYLLLPTLLSVAIPLSFGCWFLNVLYNFLYGDEDLITGSPLRWLFASIAPVIMMFYGIRKKSLDMSGAIAGLIVGFFLALSNLCFFVALLAFFILASKATKFRSRKKKLLEEDFKEGGQRNWIQVYCNGGIATHFALIYLIDTGCVEMPINFVSHYNSSWLALAVVGSIACCSGDTFASELGQVIGKGQPYLITNLRRVPNGTNGGVSLVGLLSSILGGLVVGIAYYCTLILTISEHQLHDSPPQWPIIVVGGLAGFLGSLIDSYMGATVQYSGYSNRRKCIVEHAGPDVDHISGVGLLNNHTVNLVASLITALLTPGIALTVWRYAT